MNVHLCRCLIVSPNIIHLGVDETVSVQLHEATKATSMHLYFKDQVLGKMVSIKESITLNEDNQYQAVVKLQASSAKHKRML